MDEEVEQNWRRVGNQKYHYDKRTRAAIVANKRLKMLTWKSVGKVLDKRCCNHDCIQKFRPASICTLQTKMHLQTFQVKVSKILDVHRMTYDGAERQRKVVTLEGIDMYLDAWMNIHKVSWHTFERYEVKAEPLHIATAIERR